MHLFKRIAVVVSAMTLLVLVGSIFPASGQEQLGTNRLINVWEAATGSLLLSIPTEEIIWDAALNRDGTRIAALLDGGIARVYERNGAEQTLTVERILPKAQGVLPELMPSEDPDVWFILWNERFWLWDISNDEILLEGEPAVEYARGLMSPDRSKVLTIVEVASYGYTIKVFDIDSGELFNTGYANYISDAAWSPDSRRIAYTDDAGYGVIDSTTGENLLYVRDDSFSYGTSDARWSPDGITLLFTASTVDNYGSAIALLDGETLEERWYFQFGSGMSEAHWSADSTRYISAAYVPNGVRIYSYYGELLQTIGDDDSTLFRNADWNSDETRIITDSYASGATVSIWDAQSGDFLDSFTFDEDGYATWNPDHSALFLRFYADTGSMAIVNVNGAEVEPIHIEHPDYLLGAQWSADGQYIVTRTGELQG